jgi:uncharacterized protein YndB with AHSA1/START domain
MAAPSLYRATAAITIRTTPEAAFDAWLDPRQAARFLAPHPTTVGEFTNDPREGGAFRLVMEGAGERFEHSGRYVVIERPQRLVFTWISAGTDHRLSLVTLVFTPSSGGVRIDLEHEGIPDAERALRHERGWGSILGKLAAVQHGTDR